MCNSKFKVGDKVFSVIHGWGTVVGFLQEDQYPIKVSFVHMTRIGVFTVCGKSSIYDLLPSLLTKEEALRRFPEYAPPKKKVPVKVWMRVDEDGRRFYYTIEALTKLALEVKGGQIVELTGEMEE